MCDLMMPSAYVEQRRVARVSHKCCECFGRVEPAEPYLYVSGVWDHVGKSYKICARCAEARELALELTAEIDCGPAFEGLADWLVETYEMHGSLNDVIAAGLEQMRENRRASIL